MGERTRRGALTGAGAVAAAAVGLPTGSTDAAALVDWETETVHPATESFASPARR